jgi:hypothetical protein
MRSLRVEDAAIAGWNALGVPLVALSALKPVIELGAEPNVAAGIIQLAAVIAAIVAIATRPAGTTAQAAPGPTVGTLPAIIGPLVGAIAFVSGSASAYLGITLDEPAILVAGVAIVAAMAFGDRLPVIDATLRRILILPFILICSGIFNGFAANLLDGLDIRAFVGAGLSAEGGFVLFLGVMLLGGLAAFYAALVAAPRQLADPSHPGFWPIRFLVYLVSSIFGIGWLSVL